MKTEETDRDVKSDVSIPNPIAGLMGQDALLSYVPLRSADIKAVFHEDGLLTPGTPCYHGEFWVEYNHEVTKVLVTEEVQKFECGSTIPAKIRWLRNAADALESVTKGELGKVTAEQMKYRIMVREEFCRDGAPPLMQILRDVLQEVYGTKDMTKFWWTYTPEGLYWPTLKGKQSEEKKPEVESLKQVLHEDDDDDNGHN